MITDIGQIFYSVLSSPYDLEVKVMDRNQKFYVKLLPSSIMWLQVLVVAYNLLSTTSNIVIFSTFCNHAVVRYHVVSAMLLFKENKA